MSSLRARLALRRMRLVAHGALLRSELSADLSGLRQKAGFAVRLASLVPLVRPLLSFAWRRWRAR